MKKQGYMHASRTNFLCQMVPLEPFQVLEAPQVIVVGIPSPPPHWRAIEGLFEAFSYCLVLELHPSLCETLASVFVAAFALGSQCRVCGEETWLLLF